MSHLSVLSGSLVDDLLLEHGGLGETEGDLVGGQSLVGVGNNVELVLHDFLVEGVDEDLLLVSSLDGHSHSLAGDVGGEHLECN